MIFHRSTRKATTKPQHIQKKNHNNNNMVKNITLKTALHQMHKQTKVRNVVKHHNHTLRKMRQHTRIMKGGLSFKDIFKSIFRPKKSNKYTLLKNPKNSAITSVSTSDKTKNSAIAKTSAIANTKPNTDFTYYTNNKVYSPIHNGDEFFIVINTSKPKECAISLHYKITLDINNVVPREIISSNYTFIVKTAMTFTRTYVIGEKVVKETFELTNEKQEFETLNHQLLICNNTNPPYYYYNTFKVESKNIFTDDNNEHGVILGSNIPTTSFFVDIKITLYSVSEETTKGRKNITYIKIKEITHERILLTKADTLHIINFVRETYSNKYCSALIKNHDTSYTLVYLDYLKKNIGMPETEYKMLSRMNTNIEFYYGVFTLTLDVKDNDGHAQRKHTSLVHLACYLNNIYETKSRLTVNFIIRIPSEDSTFIEPNAVEQYKFKYISVIVEKLSFSYVDINDKLELIHIAIGNPISISYNFINNTTSIYIRMETLFEITHEKCQILLHNKPTNMLVTIKISNTNKKTITFKKTIETPVETFKIIPSTEYIAFLQVYDSELPVAPVQTTRSISTSTPTPKANTAFVSSMGHTLSQVHMIPLNQTTNILVEYTYYKLTLFPKAGEYIIYIEIEIDKKNKSNPGKLRIYYIQQKQQPQQNKQNTQDTLQLTFSLDFNYYISNKAFTYESLPILMNNLGINYNKIRDDATNTSLYTNNYDGQEVLDERARHTPGNVNAFQKNKYGKQLEKKQNTPLITLSSSNIFMFNIVINKHHNNTYIGVCKPVKNTQDFILLLIQICAINKRYFTEESNIKKKQDIKPILIDLTIHKNKNNNNKEQKTKLQIELMDATKDKTEIEHINSF